MALALWVELGVFKSWEELIVVGEELTSILWPAIERDGALLD